MRKVLKCSLVSTGVLVTSREGTAPCSLTCDFAFFAPFTEAASGAQGPCYSGPPVLSGPWRCARGLGAMASYKNCASAKAFTLPLSIIIEKAQNRLLVWRGAVNATLAVGDDRVDKLRLRAL